MSQEQGHQSKARGQLAPSKTRWQEESQDSAEEEMPRRNREGPQAKQPFKPKFVPREQDVGNKNSTNNSNDDFKYRKDAKNKTFSNNDYDRNEKKERQYQKYNERDYEKKDQRERKEKREVGKDLDRTTNAKNNREKNDELNDYSIEEVPRRPLPNPKNPLNIKENKHDYYVSEAKRLLEKCQYITLFGYNNMIGETFAVADSICLAVKNLDRINIPDTDQIDEILHPKKEGNLQRKRTKYYPMISIELSKGNLNDKHIGHQTYKNKQSDKPHRETERPKKEYKEKVQKQ